MSHALEVDNRVAGVDGRVVSVDNSVEGRVGRVTGVDEKVRFIDDKIAAVIDGAQSSSICRQENMFNSDVPRRGAGKGSLTTSSKRHR